MLKELQNGRKMVRINFGRKLNLQKLHYYPGIWSVQSELSSSLCYGIADGMMAAIRPEGAIACKLEDVEEVAQMMIPEVQEELLETYRIWKETRK